MLKTDFNAKQLISVKVTPVRRIKRQMRLWGEKGFSYDDLWPAEGIRIL